jgi:hypothetical protein
MTVVEGGQMCNKSNLQKNKNKKEEKATKQKGKGSPYNTVGLQN